MSFSKYTMSADRLIPTQRYKNVRGPIREALTRYIGEEFEIFGDARWIAPMLKRKHARLIAVYKNCALFETTAGTENNSTTVFNSMFRTHAPIRFAPSLTAVAMNYKPVKVKGTPWEFFNPALICEEEEEEDV